jgi:LemA protein
MATSANWHLILPATDVDFPWTQYLGAYLCISIFYCAANQFIVQRTLAAKDEWHARMGVVFTDYLKFFLPLIIVVPGCGTYNRIVALDESAGAAWANVETVLQRRYDLIPNLVNTVKGYAAHEQETLQAVVEARAKVSQMTVSADIINDPAALKAFDQNQAALSSALSRLLVVVERYPDLKANENFLTLQSQLEGTENRIAVARRDFIQAVQRYNTEIRTFPGRIWHSMLYRDLPMRETFEARAGVEEAPKVEF